MTRVGVLVLLVCACTFAYNVDHRSPAVMQPSGEAEADSLFGFSIALHRFPDGAYGLLVGAPRDVAADGNKTGGVYRCAVQHGATCQRVTAFDSLEDQYIREAVEDFGGFNVPSGQNFSNKREEVDGQLLGFTVEENMDHLGTCAPRYVYNPEPNTEGRAVVAQGIGRCVVLKDDYTENTLPVLQYRRDSRGIADGSDMYLAGSDAVFVEKGGKPFFLMGEPLGEFSLTQQQESFGRLRVQELVEAFTPDFITGQVAMGASDQLNGYLGFCVKKGNFLSATLQHVAASSPRSNNHLGRVHFFQIAEDPNRIELVPEQELNGNQLDGYYGYDFSTIKVTDDNFDSVVVGCPLCDGERGRIFFHLNDKSSFALPVEIVSPLDEAGRFGMAVENIGDIDNDGYEDVAVGAPYAANGGGVVFVFRGTSGGILLQPSQCIDQPDTAISNFGFSLSGPADIDNNGYSDFSVGGLSAGTASPVVTYRSSPTVNLAFSMTAPQRLDLTIGCEQNDTLTCFEVEVCLRFTDSTIQTFELQYLITVDANFTGEAPRALLDPFNDSSVNYHMNQVLLNHNVEECQKTVFYIRPDVTELRQNIDVNVTVMDATEPLPVPGGAGQLGGALHPVLNVSSDPQSRALFKTKEIAFVASCGDDDICEPEYVLSVATVGDLVYLSDEHDISFTVVVTNSAEESGLAPRLIVAYPRGVAIKRQESHTQGALPQSRCESGGPEQLLCRLKSVIRPHNEEVVNLTITFAPLTAFLQLNTSSLQFLFTIEGHANTMTSHTLPVNAVAQYDLDIFSTGGDLLTAYDVYNYDQNPNNNASSPFNTTFPFDQIGPNANMQYIVRNNQSVAQGSQIHETLLTVYWPVRLKGSPDGGLTELRSILLVPQRIVTENEVWCEHFGINPLEGDPRLAGLTTPRASGPPPSIPEGVCSNVECAVLECQIFNLKPSSDSRTITVQAVLWSYSVTENFDLTIWATVSRVGEEPEVATVTQSLKINVNAAVQEYPTQCPNQFIPIIAVFTGLACLFIIVLLLAVFGFFGQTALRKKLQAAQEKKTVSDEPEDKRDEEYDDAILSSRIPTPPPEVIDREISKPKIITPMILDTGSRASSISSSCQQARYSPPGSVRKEGGVVHLSRRNFSPMREETAV